MAELEMGSGALVGWSLLRIEGERVERTLRALLLKLVNHTTVADGAKLLAQEQKAFEFRTYGALIRDTTLELEAYGQLDECERLAVQVGLRAPGDAALAAAAQAIVHAVGCYRMLAPGVEVLPPPMSCAQPVLEERDTVCDDMRNWSKPEWDTFFGADTPQELVKWLFTAVDEWTTAKAELADTIAMHERNGDLAELADAKRKLQASVDRKLKAWQRTQVCVEAVIWKIPDPKGKPWAWPCKGLKTNATHAKIQAAKDAKRLEESKA